MAVMSQERDKLYETVEVEDEDVVDLAKEMGPEELAALRASIQRGRAQIRAGLGIPAEQVLARLRARR